MTTAVSSRRFSSRWEGRRRPSSHPSSTAAAFLTAWVRHRPCGWPATPRPRSPSSPKSRARATRCACAARLPPTAVQTWWWSRSSTTTCPSWWTWSLGELQARGLGVRQLLHPIFKTQRDAAGRLQRVLGPGDQNWNDGHQESYIAIYLAVDLAEAAAADVVGTLSAILDEVRAAVGDWQAMLWMVQAAARRLEETPPRVPAAELQEALAFLRWLAADNFTFLGAREYRLPAEGETAALIPDETVGLGLLRDSTARALRRDARRPSGTAREAYRLNGAPAPLRRHQGEPSEPRASARLRGLRRRQELPPRRHRARRGPHRRPFHLAGVHDLAARHSSPAPQGREGASR